MQKKKPNNLGGSENHASMVPMLVFCFTPRSSGGIAVYPNTRRSRLSHNHGTAVSV